MTIPHRFKQVFLCSPSGALIDTARYERALEFLHGAGFEIKEGAHARDRVQRFGGEELDRANDLELAVNELQATLILASRGGYGVSRLLPRLDLAKLSDALNKNGHLLCGHSDITALQLALLKSGAKPETLLHGPMACFDFGGEEGVNASTLRHFEQALSKTVSIDWHTTFDQSLATSIQGPVWGGNLTLLCALLGTPWMPQIEGGLLVLEDVNEPTYKVERMLLQLAHAGILSKQKVVVLGQFNEPAPTEHDNGYGFAEMIAYVQSVCVAPILGNFPFGHCTPKACWFQGAPGTLSLQANANSQVSCSLIQHV